MPARKDPKEEVSEMILRGRVLRAKATRPSASAAQMAGIESDYKVWYDYLEAWVLHHLIDSEIDRFSKILRPQTLLKDDAEMLQAAIAGWIDDLLTYLRGLEKRFTLVAREQFGEADGGTTSESVGRSVLVVHGRDHVVRDQVELLLRKIRAQVTILEDQPNLGRLLLEKFEDSAAGVDFVVVLATADDEGRLRDSGTELELRARQNVIFEVGYAFGRLGRGRTAVLYEKEVALPADIDGLAYIPLEGDWRGLLVRELRAADLPLDYDELF